MVAQLIVYWDCSEHTWITAIVEGYFYNVWECLRKIDYFLPNRVGEDDIYIYRKAYDVEIEKYGFGIVNKGSKRL